MADIMEITTNRHLKVENCCEIHGDYDKDMQVNPSKLWKFEANKSQKVMRFFLELLLCVRPKAEYQRWIWCRPSCPHSVAARAEALPKPRQTNTLIHKNNNKKNNFFPAQISYIFLTSIQAEATICIIMLIFLGSFLSAKI